jgi:hypothetical protein
MKKKDILELKKRLKKDRCTFTKMCGCYINGEKEIILRFRETFLNLEEDDYFKFMEIAKKVLSGTVGNNILELNFPLNEDLTNERQISLLQLKGSQLKDDALLDDFYRAVIDNYDYTGNLLILLFHDAYDVIAKATDNSKLDESEEVFEYVLCAICPVSLLDPGLRYFEEENRIKSRTRDWVVEAPTNGFVFPAFIDRSSDVNTVMYYTRNPKDTHPELMENALGCKPKQTTAIQKETFQSVIKDTFGADEEKAEKVFLEIQDNLSTMIEEHNSVYGDTDSEPIALTKNDVQELLIESGVPEEVTAKIEKSYEDSFGEDLPLAENLIDQKAMKANAQKRREEDLKRQVEILETRLERMKQESPVEAGSGENQDSAIEDKKEEASYDIILQVKPEKVPQIRSQIVDGQRCIVIPVGEDEQAAVNGLEGVV